MARPIHRYSDGSAYRLAKGRKRPDDAIENARDFYRQMAVVNLHGVQPSPRDFLKAIVRELRIRCYSRNSVKSYRAAIGSFLRWAGLPPVQIDREHVREYLEYLVDGGHASNTLGVHLSAIRTSFDKFCFQDITLGLATPRKPKKLPIVLSKEEIVRLLEAAVSRRDTLLLGLMYATGMRVSEVVRTRLRDIDLDRNIISVWQGKGLADRHVMLPESYRELFQWMKTRRGGDDFLFPSEGDRKGRYLSPRTVQRVMQRTIELAGITKLATPHSLRHSFATHSFENGCDIRRIQKVLGHVNLETTTIYVRVAQPTEPAKMPSPLDGIRSPGRSPDRVGAGRSIERPVGTLRIHSRDFAGENSTRVTIEIAGNSRVYLTGVRAVQSRTGFWTLQFPPSEDWKQELAGLPARQRARFEEADFYRLLQIAIVEHLAGKPGNKRSMVAGTQSCCV